MAAERSLKQELAGAEQHLESLVCGPVGQQWRRDAIARAHDRVRQIRAEIAKAKP